MVLRRSVCKTSPEAELFTAPTRLVFRVRHTLPVYPDLVERVECAALVGKDVIGSLAPDEGLWVGVVLQ